MRSFCRLASTPTRHWNRTDKCRRPESDSSKPEPSQSNTNLVVAPAQKNSFSRGRRTTPIVAAVAKSGSRSAKNTYYVAQIHWEKFPPRNEDYVTTTEPNQHRIVVGAWQKSPNGDVLIYCALRRACIEKRI